MSSRKGWLGDNNTVKHNLPGISDNHTAKQTPPSFQGPPLPYHIHLLFFKWIYTRAHRRAKFTCSSMWHLESHTFVYFWIKKRIFHSESQHTSQSHNLRSASPGSSTCWLYESLASVCLGDLPVKWRCEGVMIGPALKN